MSISSPPYSIPQAERVELDPTSYELPSSISPSPHGSTTHSREESAAFNLGSSAHGYEYLNKVREVPETPLWPFEGLQRTNPLPVQTPLGGTFAYPQVSATPTNTNWSDLPPPPPNTADPTFGILPSPYGTQHTSLSPMLAGWNTTPSAPERPPGPVRGYTTPATYQRRRSSTLASLASATSQSPATPNMVFGQYPAAYPYPYPSPRNPATPVLHRRPSAPLITHPPQSTTAGGMGMTGLNNSGGGFKRLHPTPAGSPGSMELAAQPDADGEKKPPRFKPTKEQLEILIAAYEENKNPDGATRDALAKRLGPDVRPKTLQIWFQNRRSKSRAKEREAGIPKTLSLKGALFGRVASLGGGRRGVPAVDPDALRTLTHDDDPNLIVLPITVLSISPWTRFLTPGAGYYSPDLGLAIRTTHPAAVRLYVVHKGETFRLSLPISSNCISRVYAADNPSLNADAVAVRLDLVPTAAEYSCWKDGEWKATVDFTGGAASSGGRCEITGDRDVLLPAFNSVHRLLGGGEASSPLSPGPLTGVDPITPFPHTWRFPTNNTNVATSSSALQSASIQTATPSVSLFSPDSVYSTDSASAPTYDHASLNLLPTAQPGLGQHHRQRSFSAPLPPHQIGGNALHKPLDRMLSYGSDDPFVFTRPITAQPHIELPEPASAALGFPWQGMNGVDPSAIGWHVSTPNSASQGGLAPAHSPSVPPDVFQSFAALKEAATELPSLQGGHHLERSLSGSVGTPPFALDSMEGSTSPSDEQDVAGDSIGADCA